MAAPAAAYPNPLAFTMQKQLQDNWCWAATASSVAAYYRDPDNPSQCDLAKKYIQNSCCPKGQPNLPACTCNEPYQLITPLQVLGRSNGDAQPGALDFDSIATEIDAGRPVCIRIDINPPNGHFLVIIGYDRSTGDVYLCDPEYKVVGPHPWSQVGAAVGGSWNESYKTQ
ncbi:MAG TPA: C39 family peptidase [Rhizomicrobium sp.]|nr:C39 family peptidase [Rhizomicrobium sp.]